MVSNPAGEADASDVVACKCHCVGGVKTCDGPIALRFYGLDSETHRRGRSVFLAALAEAGHPVEPMVLSDGAHSHWPPVPHDVHVKARMMALMAVGVDWQGYETEVA